MTLSSPLWLLLLPLGLAAVWLVARAGTRTVPRKQHRWALALRFLGVAALVLALAQPLVARPVGQRSVLFLLDRSASIPTDARLEQERYVADALDGGGPEDLSAVAVFGSEMLLDTALAQGRSFRAVRTVVDDSATDLATALRTAAAVLPTEGSRRIVVLSDAVETQGDARTAARELAESGIAVDVVPTSSGRAADALVERVELPATVRAGEIAPVRVTIQSNTAGPATATLTVNGEVAERAQVDLAAGRTSVTFDIPVEEQGFLRVGVQVSAGFDALPANDVGEGLARVEGPARVVMVEGTTGEGAELQEALEAGGVTVERVSTIPDDSRLLEYDAIVAVNLPAPAAEDTARVAAFVEELGRGLLVVGGDDAYGLGDYQDTPFEDLLPVRSDPDDLIRRQPVAEVLVVDTSGSMGRCHCNDGEFAEGGVNKTDISRAGAALAIDALSSSDRVGVLAFSSGTDWVLPLGRKPSAAEAEAALAGLFPDGDTEIARALEIALDELRTADEPIRHIVLFTDGWDPNEARLLPVAQEIADAGVTLSVLGTGEGPGTTLARMATVGGGRYYPGTDLDAVPQVFAEETLAVARNLAQEGTFFPVLGAASPVTAELSAAPPLAGYVLTRSKTTASVALEIGEGDPLLATWQRGLGRVTAWTSDASARWSADWLPWDGFVSFWGRALRDVLPSETGTPPEVRVSGGTLDVAFSAPDAPLDAIGLARVRDPNGEVSVLPLQRSGEGNFTGRLRVSASGAYWVATTVQSGETVLASGSSGAVSSYPDEFLFREPDPALPADLAALTDGRLDPEPGAAFDPVAARGSADTALWPLLAAIALALFMADVALRRLVLAEGDLQAWGRAIRPGKKIPPEPDGDVPEAPDSEPVPEQETVSRLLRRKRR